MGLPARNPEVLVFQIPGGASSADEMRAVGVQMLT